MMMGEKQIMEILAKSRYGGVGMMGQGKESAEYNLRGHGG